MTDKAIANMIVQGAQKSLARYHQHAKIDDPQTTDLAVIAEYLSGGSQVANFLSSTDGGVTPQQVERALKIAGESLGLFLGRPE